MSNFTLAKKLLCGKIQIRNIALIIKFIAYLCVFISATPVDALDLAEAFDTLVSSVNPGIYHSQVRGYLTAGGFNVHFPSDNVQLISLSPPHYSAGCTGVNLYLGGFSYISSQQFTSLLKTISTSSLGYSFQLALRTLCPICSTVVSDLQKAVQAANKLALDQCEMAEGIIQTGIQSNAALNQWLNGQSAQQESSSGEATDYLSALHNLTGDLTLGLNKLAESINEIAERGNKQQAIQNLRLGSSTWNLLSGLTDIQKIFIQSLIGSTVITAIKMDNTKSQSPIIMHLPATLTPEALAKVFLYGAKARENSNVYLWDCKDTSSLFSEKDSYCMEAYKVPLLQSKWYKNSHLINNISLAEVGFFGMTYAILFQALYNMVNSHPLGTAERVALPGSIYSNLSNDSLTLQPAFTADQITAFISLAPLPLYRALNIGAIYPEIAQALISNVSTIVANNYTISYLKQILDIKHADNSKGGTIGMSPQAYVELEATLRNITTNVDQQLMAMFTTLQANAAWTAQINEVQSLVYSQIIASGLGANFAYNAAISGTNL